VAYGVEKRPHLKNNGRTANISEGGMKLLMDEKLPKGTILNLELELPDPKKTIKIEGEVVWSDEAEKAEGSDKRLFHSGIKLLAIKGPFPTDFISYIRSLTKDIEV
jgi:c-di-GMP-binding flagellar brake protein YcgR